MASKKTTKSIQVKTKFKKPVKSSQKAIDEAARIRKNEQNRLYRLNKKFDKTKKKGEADKLRREIKSLSREISNISSVILNIRKKDVELKTVKKEITSLKLQNAAINRKLNKKYSSKQFDKEYKDLNNQFVKNTGLIKGKTQQAAVVIYEINKNLGFDPVAIAENTDISDRTLQKNFEDDFEEDYFEGGGDGLSTKSSDGEDVEEEIIEEDEEAEEADRFGWVAVDYSTFWSMWKDYDSTEKNNLMSYDQIVFDFDGNISKFKGTSDSLINMKAAEMWRWCASNGDSNTTVTKYKNIDGNKLKYVVE
jgi:hypothetical protein